ncbi:MAG: hypothetical protein ACE5HZ_08495, partial [Fidelibacterota bacterium]
MAPLSSHLLPFRRRKLLNDLQALGWGLLLGLALGTVVLVTLEAIFWFPIPVRSGFWLAFAALGLLTLAVSAVLLLLIRRNRLPRYSLSQLARDVGKKGFVKRDQVINALQLEEDSGSAYPTSRELAAEFVDQIASKLDRLNPARVMIHQRVPAVRTAALGTVAVSLALWAAFFPQFGPAAKHWVHPGVNFPVPLPFELVSPTGNLSIMGGDTAKVVLLAKGVPPEESRGTPPDSVILEIIDAKGAHFTSLAPSHEGRFVHTLPRVLQNIRYRGFARSRHFWQPWDEISSPTYEIRVTDRPTIKDFMVTISPPPYANMESMSQRENIAEIRALKGSSLKVDLTANKALSRAHLTVVTTGTPEKESVVPMTVDEEKAQAEMILVEEGTFQTHVFDLKGTGNLDPIQYRFIVIQDAWPLLQVLDPQSPLELGSDFSVPARLHVEDDFGFSSIQIVYEMHKPDYLAPGPSPQPGGRGRPDRVRIQPIDVFDPGETSQDVFYAWDVSGLGLMPEDEVHFHFEVYDNDLISGPKKSVSETLIARFPSLADLYARTEEQQDDILKDAREIVEDLKDLEKTLEDAELELLKDDRIQWQQEQTLKKSQSEVQERLDTISELRQKVQEIIDQSEKHTLFSPELVDKFRRLQTLLQDIMTPELMESLEKMREAMEDVTADQLLKALKDFRVNTAQLEEQLDRFIDIFERIRAEQSMDELVSRTEALLERQESLLDKLSRTEPGEDLATLGEEQERNAQEFENVHDLMSQASRTMEPFARMPAGELSRLAQSDLSASTSRDLKAASRHLRQERLTSGTQWAQSGQGHLQKILEQLEGIR